MHEQSIDASWEEQSGEPWWSGDFSTQRLQDYPQLGRTSMIHVNAETKNFTRTMKSIQKHVKGGMWDNLSSSLLS